MLITFLDADAANPHKFERNFKHLCAIDCFPNLEILKARSLEGCEFCRLLRDTLLSPGAIDYDYCNYRGMEDLSSEPFCVWVQWRWNQTSRTRHDAPNTLSCLTVHIWSYKVLLGNDRWDFCIESTDGKPRLVNHESVIILLTDTCSKISIRAPIVSTTTSGCTVSF